MALSSSWAIAVAIVYVLSINNICTGQSHIRDNDLVSLPEPRAYIPDADLLDFVYHNHDEMTKFLR